MVGVNTIVLTVTFPSGLVWNSKFSNLDVKLDPGGADGSTHGGCDVVPDLSCSFPPGHGRWRSRPNNLAESLVSPASRHRVLTVQQGNAEWSDWKETRITDKWRRGWSDPTVHVNLDRVGHRVTDVVVRGLAGQNGVKIRALQVLNEQRVDGLPSLLLLVTPVNQGVFSPPVQLWRWRPCRSRQLVSQSGPGLDRISRNHHLSYKSQTPGTGSG